MALQNTIQSPIRTGNDRDGTLIWKTNGRRGVGLADSYWTIRAGPSSSTCLRTFGVSFKKAQRETLFENPGFIEPESNVSLSKRSFPTLKLEVAVGGVSRGRRVREFGRARGTARALLVRALPRGGLQVAAPHRGRLSQSAAAQLRGGVRALFQETGVACISVIFWRQFSRDVRVELPSGVGAYGSQTCDINIALTAIGMHWAKSAGVRQKGPNYARSLTRYLRDVSTRPSIGLLKQFQRTLEHVSCGVPERSLEIVTSLDREPRHTPVYTHSKFFDHETLKYERPV